MSHKPIFQLLHETSEKHPNSVTISDQMVQYRGHKKGTEITMGIGTKHIGNQLLRGDKIALLVLVDREAFFETAGPDYGKVPEPETPIIKLY